MATVGVSLCREITEKIGPPRTLQVPFAFGYPLGAPRDPELQGRILRAALRLLEETGPPPVTAEYD